MFDGLAGIVTVTGAGAALVGLAGAKSVGT